MKHLAPTVFASSFSCPHCGAIAQQNWWSISLDRNQYAHKDNELRVGTCAHCRKNTVWFLEEMLVPTSGAAPFPNVEMPINVREYYIEAAGIISKSPRAAAALLRLAIQLLCKELGEKGKNINDDIASLVSKGLPDVVQQSLDIVRVTGNEAVHPGQIDADDPAVVGNLFELLNIIVEYMIAMPKRVSGLYSALPPQSLSAISKRDN
jgi:hypothetical protein